MTYEAPEMFDLGDVEDLTFGGCGCWTDHETQDGEEELIDIFAPPPLVAE